MLMNDSSALITRSLLDRARHHHQTIRSTCLVLKPSASMLANQAHILKDRHHEAQQIGIIGHTPAKAGRRDMHAPQCAQPSVQCVDGASS